MTTVSVARLSPALGAEVSGVNLCEPLDGDTVAVRVTGLPAVEVVGLTKSDVLVAMAVTP